MGIQDLIVTPIWFFIFLTLAYAIRSKVTTPETRPYFIPGLLAKFVGAIALGCIYQFYYGGGDTFSYHSHGSRWIWEAFMTNPITGIELLFQKAGDYNGETYAYSSKIWMFRNKAAMFIVKISTCFDLFTFNTYSSTALFFAAFAFSGHWVLFIYFQKLYPEKTKQFAIATLFIPSVIFWGSGILKDSVTLASLCWVTYALFNIAIWKKNIFTNVSIFLFFSWVIYSIKIYILLCFLVSASIFLYKVYSGAIKNGLVRIILAPVFLIFFTAGGFFTMQKISEDDSRYALDQLGKTAMITAYDIRYGWGARGGDNSGYTLGNLDGSIISLVKLAPKGVVVTLFRPWLWEVRNPLMLLSALESLALLLFSIYILFLIKWKHLWKKINNPIVLYCLSFSLLFAFAVGVSTYNFGTLMRYKIPVMPFYSLTLLMLYTNKRKV